MQKNCFLRDYACEYRRVERGGKPDWDVTSFVVLDTALWWHMTYGIASTQIVESFAVSLADRGSRPTPFGITHTTSLRISRVWTLAVIFGNFSQADGTVARESHCGRLAFDTLSAAHLYWTWRRENRFFDASSLTN